MNAARNRPAIAGHGHGGVMRAMHGATVLLLLGTNALAWAIEDAGTTAEAAWLAMLHRSLGLGILALTAVRLAWRRRTAVPPLPADLPASQRLPARAGTIAVYALLGLAGSLLHGDHVTLSGRFALPAVLPVDRPLAHRIVEVHGWIALLLLVLIGLHVAAALHHHVIRRDRMLAGMLPWCSPSPARPGKARA